MLYYQDCQKRVCLFSLDTRARVKCGEVELTYHSTITVAKTTIGVFISMGMILPNAIRWTRECWLVGAYAVWLGEVVGGPAVRKFHRLYTYKNIFNIVVV